MRNNDRVRKIIFLTLILIFSTIVIPANSATTPKPGAACKSYLMKIKSTNQTFTCVKLGKKLIWKRTQEEVKPIEASPKVYPENFELNFKNILENYQAIPYLAWKKSSEQFQKSLPKDVDVKIFISPNTKPLTSDPKKFVTMTSRLFGDYQQVSEFILVYYTYKDIDWAQSYVDQYIGKDGGYDNSKEASKMCQTEFNCTSAAVLMNQKTKISLAIMTTPSGLNTVNDFATGVREAHEYSHTIQDKQYVGRLPDGIVPPNWLIEGSAEFIQIATIYNNSFQKYSGDRKFITKDLFYPANINADWLTEFLNSKDLGKRWDLWENYDGWRSYDVGFMVSEIMAAIAGPNSIMEMFKNMGDGLSFQESFLKVFGTSWDEAFRLINKAIIKELS